MPDTNQQQNTSGSPMVLVKKSDGTTERVSLDKVMKMKKEVVENKDQKIRDMGVKKTPVVPSTPINTPKKVSSPPAFVTQKKSATPAPTKQVKKIVKTGEKSLSTTAPVKDVFKDMAVASGKNQVARNKKQVETQKEPAVVKKEKSKLAVSMVPEKKVVEPKKVEAPEPVLKKSKSGSTDFSSLLEESIDKGIQSDDSPALSSNRVGIFDRVVASLGFTIPKDLIGRAQSLIQSRVKEVRSDDQVRDYAGRPVSEGGLGLSEDNAVGLVSVLHGIMNGSTVPKKKISAPVPVPAPEKKMPIKTPIPKSVGRPVLHDVIPAVPQAKTQNTVGPVDEIGAITLIDFQRLAADRGEAKQLLLQKFETLKEDSYIQYLKGRNAWFISPLYLQYKEIVMQSINSGEAVDAVLQKSETKEKLSKEEFLIIAEVNKNLNI